MKVRFIPQNVEFDIKPGQSVLHVAQDNNIYVKSVCKGVPSCAECRVRVVDGEHNVLPPGSEELSLIGTGHFIDRRRLSCQLKCFGDITVDMNEQIAKQSGLIGGQKKKKLAIKDDRIEDATTIRSSEGSTSGGSDEPGTGDEPAAPAIAPRPQMRREPRPPREPREPRAAGSGEPRAPRENREPRPAVGDAPRPPRPQQAAPPLADGAEPAAGEGGQRKRRRRGGRGGRGGEGRPPQGGGGGGSAGPIVPRGGGDTRPPSGKN